LKDLLDIYERLFRAFGPQHWWPGETPFEVAVGAILTQNTNWSNVERAIKNLKRHRALSAKKIYSMPIERLREIIRPAGYFNVKARRLKSFVGFLMENYAGSLKNMSGIDTERLREELLGVHGIGQETADSILLYALGRAVFVIDAYTKRVLSRHGVLAYEEPYYRFQRLFHDSLPNDVKLFNEYHALFVRVGKDFCKKKPLCNGCPLEIL